MTFAETIRYTHTLSMTVLKSYVSDLTDTEMMQRPGPGCNHLAWQLGHLIASEVGMLNQVCPNAVELPPGFAERHSKATAESNDPALFLTKQEYLDLHAKVTESTMAALDGLTEEQLNAPAPESMRRICPTMGTLFVLIATHPMMHAGQFVPVRRALGKPVLI